MTQTFTPGQRVTIPDEAFTGRVPATVVCTFFTDARKPETAYAVCVEVDGLLITCPLPDVHGAYHDHDRDADHPNLCETCGNPVRPSHGNFCSEQHRRVMYGEEPTMKEQALNL